MFTGIVSEQGEIIGEEQSSRGSVLIIRCKEVLPALKIGDSISIDGVCLTVVEKAAESFQVEATPETLRLTNLGSRRPGDRVNLEPAARIADFLSGHLVQGHVDGRGKVQQVREEGNSRIIRFSAPEKVLSYCTLKGSIAVNGVSLTLSGLEPGSFEVTLIPHTLKVTNFAQLEPGDEVNLEADVISKYVESHVKRILGVVAMTLLLSVQFLVGGDLSIGSNTILIYENTSGGKASQFVIRLARYRPDIVFEWESATDQGTVHLFKGAVQNSVKFTLTGLFEVGVDSESPRQTTVWLSNRIYRDLIHNKRTRIALNNSPLKMEVTGEEGYSLLVDKEPVDVTVVRVQDTRRGNWAFLKNPESPLVIEYKSPYFHHRLKAVSNAPVSRLRWIRRLPPVR
ncbi:MAG: riboflavin synthase [Acidobacteriota bacterium]